MPSLQYVIDSICSSVTVECVYKIIDALLDDGPFKVDAIIPLIQSKDRSLDRGSAEMIAKSALEEMLKRDVIRIDGENIVPADRTHSLNNGQLGAQLT